MTDPAPDVEAHDPGPVPDEVDDGEAGALAAAELSSYQRAYGEPHPIIEEVRE